MKRKNIRMPILLFAMALTPTNEQFYDSHFHLNNYVQKGITLQQFLKIMGNRVGRSTLFGIPLQQQWSYRVSGSEAPTYYLDTDAPLYYYSFTDAMIAKDYMELDSEAQKRFEPMITGFNPTDMYAVDHIKRVLLMYPGVFSGIGEFTIHKEFVSSKVAGEVASITDRALDQILEFSAEAGLVTLIHNDIQTPFAKHEQRLIYYEQLVDLFRRHPKTTLIWAHIGLGRVVQPIAEFSTYIEKILMDPQLRNVYFDISWIELAKYLNATPSSTQRAAVLFNRYPDRFLFGTDEVAPKSSEDYYKIFTAYEPLWKLLTPEASLKIRKSNFDHLFGEARKKVRSWEAKHFMKKR